MSVLVDTNILLRKYSALLAFPFTSHAFVNPTKRCHQFDSFGKFLPRRYPVFASGRPGIFLIIPAPIILLKIRFTAFSEPMNVISRALELLISSLCPRNSIIFSSGVASFSCLNVTQTLFSFCSTTGSLSLIPAWPRTPYSVPRQRLYLARSETC
jgi:hypothetical protein